MVAEEAAGYLGRPRLKEGPEGIPLPGILLDTATFPALIDDLRGLAGLEPYGIAEQPAMASALRERDELNRRTMERVGLDPPVGILENAATGAGAMAGQLVFPASGAKGALRRALTSPIEFLSPIVEPTPAAYLAGAGFGAALGAPHDVGEALERGSWDNYQRSLWENAYAEDPEGVEALLEELRRYNAE
jgi:hypothetical protein